MLKVAKNKKMIDDKKTFNFNEHGLNLTIISYANHKNANSEHQAIFESVTSMPTFTINILHSI